LALACVSAVWLIRLKDPIVTVTFAISNTNRHVGLAVLLSGEYFRAQRALPAIACYALIAPLVMIVYAKLYWRRIRSGKDASSEPNESPASG